MKAFAASITSAVFAGLVVNANAGNTVTVTDVTDWSTTPEEIVTIDTPYIPYDGGAYAGINTLSVTGAGSDDGTYNGFCIDPFHYSATGPTADYSIYPITSGDAPKAPGTLNTYTANEIGDLWAEYYSPTMSSPAAAGLQVAIWTLVSSNAVASGQMPSSDAVTFSGDTYGAAADLASLATYTGPSANLEILSGPGQDYVIDIPGQQTNTAPDGAATCELLLVAMGALILARPAILKNAANAAK